MKITNLTNLKFILSSIFTSHVPRLYVLRFSVICFLTSVFCVPCFSQQDNVIVKGKIKAESLTIPGGDGAGSFPATPVEGEVFYRQDNDTFYVYTGSGAGEGWQPVGSSGGARGCQ